MKIDHTPAGFSPVIITVETEAEAAFLRALVSSLCEGDVMGFGLGRTTATKLFSVLTTTCAKPEEYYPSFKVIFKPK